MKTAIALNGPTPDSGIGRHFGKCSHFLLLDERTGRHSVMENPGKNLEQGRGDRIVGLLLAKHVRRVIAGDFGTKVQQLLNEYLIQMILLPDHMKDVNKIIESLTKQNKNATHGSFGS
jgi:predicted Fe-Mo cluster-binding NifX family protein